VGHSPWAGMYRPPLAERGEKCVPVVWGQAHNRTNPQRQLEQALSNDERRHLGVQHYEQTETINFCRLHGIEPVDLSAWQVGMPWNKRSSGLPAP
jgi:hypothetical protein